ncbi:low temperature requirement protein A [Solwaraspora sp. WMMB335]|uniref:low temperature requirement protein A n=1 Tax=Solwaraspora sp. WMMB335 TaxID=3404118 RepID=UPI003B922BBB
MKRIEQVGPGGLHLVRPGARVDRLEIFFDLVYVFAFYNITRVTAGELTGRGLIAGMLVLALLWWAWCSHMVLANRVRVGEGSAPLAMFMAMAAVFITSLSIPQAFIDEPGGLPGPLVVPCCYLLIRGLHLTLYWFAARTAQEAARPRWLRLFTPPLLATSLLVVAGLIPYHGFAPDTAFRLQAACWLAALAVEYAAGFALAGKGWAVLSANHWVERFELILMVALGELIISIGVGSDLIDRPITWPAVFGAGFAVAVTAAVWWLYFDLVAPAAVQAFHASAHGEPRTRLARDAYAYLHLPMIAGLILVALGMEEVLHQLGTPDIDLAAPVDGPAVPLAFGGLALFLLSHLGFQLRTLGTVTGSRVVAIAGLAVTAPVAVRIPALAGLALLTGVCVCLVLAELVLLSGSRRRLRRESLRERLTHEARESAWRRRRYR